MPKKSRGASGSATATIYQLKITLNDVRPPVWRRVQVGDCSLAELHYIIQTCMGWENCHLHAFEVDGVAYSDPEMGGGVDFCDSHSRTLSQLASQGLSRFVYQYDFGDDWQHVVEIEKTVPPEPKAKYPRCIDGKRACPPEDCGGAYGYEDFLEAIHDRKHAEHNDMLEWVGGKFDPEEFDMKKANRKLQRFG